MMSTSRFILFLAGEDSGDILGDCAVRAVVERGLGARGIGGMRMVKAGLERLFDFERFPVSGFLDVLPRALFFKRTLRKMKCELARPECVGFCAVDYPGLNMKLVAFAKKLGKPVLYLEPPQVFAWKSHRAKLLHGADLGVFFPFESDAYARFGVKTQMLMHPFLESLQNVACDDQRKKTRKVLLLPGSRKAVLKRNLPLYVHVAKLLKLQGLEPIFVAARAELLRELEFLKSEFSVQVAGECNERIVCYGAARAVIAPPGTSLFEASACGSFCVAAMRPDALTYVLARMFLKVECLALPNLLLGRKAFPEIIARPFEMDVAVAERVASAVGCASENAGMELKKLLESLCRLPTVKSFVESWLDCIPR